MPIEIERKFLVVKENLPPLQIEDARVIQAGYFTKDGVAIRVTVRDHGRLYRQPTYKICFKGPGTLERPEYEYSIPEKDALELLELSPTYISKHRFIVDGWEIDRFDFPETGVFFVAEWEQSHNNSPPPNPLPSWVGKEVTEDFSYTNMLLAWRYGRKQGR